MHSNIAFQSIREQKRNAFQVLKLVGTILLAAGLTDKQFGIKIRQNYF